MFKEKRSLKILQLTGAGALDAGERRGGSAHAAEGAGPLEYCPICQRGARESRRNKSIVVWWGVSEAVNSEEHSESDGN